MTELAQEQAPAGVEPTQRGRYSLYDTPDGGYHVAYRPDDADQDQHFELPGALVTLARQAAETGVMPNPVKVAKALMGARKQS